MVIYSKLSTDESVCGNISKIIFSVFRIKLSVEVSYFRYILEPNPTHNPQVGKLFCSTEVGPMVYPLLHPAPSNPIPPKRWVALANDQLAYAGVPQVRPG